MNGTEIITPAEKELITLISQGLSSKEIAMRTKHTTPTLEKYRYNLFRKMKAFNAPHCVALALRLKLID